MPITSNEINNNKEPPNGALQSSNRTLTRKPFRCSLEDIWKTNSLRLRTETLRRVFCWMIGRPPLGGSLLLFSPAITKIHGMERN